MKNNRSSIICATDFSPHSAAAESVAAKLAQRRGERLLLVHGTDLVTGKALRTLNRRLESEGLLLRASGVEVESILAQGDRAADAVLNCIKEQEPSLLVVGCGLKGPIDRWALGSFSEKVAESASVATLVVRNPGPFEAWDWTKSRLKILLALDFTTSSDLVLRWAKKFQRIGPCDFVACHLNLRRSTPDESELPSWATRNPEALQAKLERDLHKKLRDHLGDESVPLVIRPVVGDFGATITAIAEEKGAHVIAVGAHQRHGIYRFGQFSFSREVLHQALLNVVCVPVNSKFDARDAHIPDFRRVLVATDFSEMGNSAVPFACAACAIGGLVKIVHVTPLREANRREGTGWASDLRIQLRELIPDETGARCQPPEVEILRGDDPARTICEEAERFSADVVCLASHGLGASRALHGSVTKAVLKKLERPLLVIRGRGES